MSSNGPIIPDRDTTAVVGARIWAQLVDLVILFVQTGVVGVALVWIVRPDTEGSVSGLTLVTFLTLPLYGGLLEGYWNGQTVGKRLLDIKVVDGRGTDPSVERAFLRNFPAVVLFSWLTTVVALGAIATSDRRQRVFDRAANTYVVEIPTAGPSRPSLEEPFRQRDRPGHR